MSPEYPQHDVAELTALMEELHYKASRYTDLMKENLTLKARIHKLDEYVETLEAKLQVCRDSLSLSRDRLNRGYE